MSNKFDFLVPIGLVALLVILFLAISESNFRNFGYVMTILIFIIAGSIIALKRGRSE